MSRYTSITVWTLALATGCAPPTSGGKVEPQSPAVAKKEWRPSDVAGVYYRFAEGPMRSDLVLRTNRNWSYTAGDRGSAGQDHGTYEISHGFVLLNGGNPNNVLLFEELRRLAIVRWGSRVLLVPDVLLDDFVSQVNEGQPPCLTLFCECLLRQGDENQPVEGRPVLPEPWQGDITGRAVAVRVLPGERLAGFRLDAGEDRSLTAGMILYGLGTESSEAAPPLLLADAQGAGSFWQTDFSVFSVRIIEVAEDSAVAEPASGDLPAWGDWAFAIIHDAPESGSEHN